MSKFHASLLAAALGAALAAPAGAITLVDASAAFGNTVTDYSSAGLLSFDLDLFNTVGATLRYQLTADDLAGPLSFNAVVRNFTGSRLDALSFGLNGTSFGSLGTVSRSFGGTTALSLGEEGRTAYISFSGPEYLDVSIGAATGLAGQIDWTINTGGLRAGDTITITAAVPEPGTYALMLAGLGGVVAVARRRARKGA